LSTVQALRLRAGILAATQHRGRLRHTQFVGVTGSAGKTTTKEMIAAVLGTSYRVRKSPAAANDVATVAKTVLRTTKRDVFCVVEVAAGKQVGIVAAKARILRPTIAVVTNIGHDHNTIFRGLEATAAEKRTLLDGVVPGGKAVLNADDPHVRAMGDAFDGQVITFGENSAAMVRAQDVSAAWPHPLTLTVTVNDELLLVRTRLYGRHWVTSVLAALGVASAAGLPLKRAAEAIAGVGPFPGRMEPVAVGGATFINDSVKAPFWALDCIYEFLGQAQAKRKILVVGTISDYAGSSSSKYRRAAKRGLTVADEVIFVGRGAKHALKAESPRGDAALRAFHSASEAAAYLRTHVRPGDLILLKGSHGADRFDRMLPVLATPSPTPAR